MKATLALVFVGCLVFSSAAQASLISVITWGADPSSDGTIDWSSGNAGYTHAVNFESTGAVRDVTFTSADGYGLTGATTMTFYGTDQASFSGPGGSGSNTAPTRFNGAAASTIGAITEEFYYGGGATGATLTLQGLEQNSEYRLELYQSNQYSGRLVDLSFTNAGAGSSGNSTLSGVSRGNTKITVEYMTGTNTSVSLLAVPQTSPHSLHWYAFSNAIVVPEPGTTWILASGVLALFFRRRRRNS